jgi:dephospho-CoA kinase
MLRLGLTGGIACGKTTVAQMLIRRGAHFLQADSLAHQLYAPGQPTYDKVVSHFGREILNEDGTINRSRLANLVFPNRIDELNAIVHPAVIEAQTRWMAEVERADPEGVAVVEAALLIEAGAAKDFDKIIVVICDLEDKVERYAQRTGVSLANARIEVERRGAAQLTNGQKAGHADFVINNSSSVEDTERAVAKIWQELKVSGPH